MCTVRTQTKIHRRSQAQIIDELQGKRVWEDINRESKSDREREKETERDVCN